MAVLALAPGPTAEQHSWPCGIAYPPCLGAWVVFAVSTFPSLHSLLPGPVVRGVYTTVLCPQQEPHGILSPFTWEGTGGFGPEPLRAGLS